MKLFIFIYNDAAGEREQIKEALDRMAEVTSWRYDMPHCFYIISDASAEELYGAFSAIRGNKGRFMFAEVTSNSQGMMSKDTWAFFKKAKGQ